MSDHVIKSQSLGIQLSELCIHTESFDSPIRVELDLDTPKSDIFTPVSPRSEANPNRVPTNVSSADMAERNVSELNLNQPKTGEDILTRMCEQDAANCQQIAQRNMPRVALCGPKEYNYNQMSSHTPLAPAVKPQNPTSLPSYYDTCEKLYSLDCSTVRIRGPGGEFGPPIPLDEDKPVVQQLHMPPPTYPTAPRFFEPVPASVSRGLSQHYSLPLTRMISVGGTTTWEIDSNGRLASPPEECAPSTHPSQNRGNDPELRPDSSRKAVTRIGLVPGYNPITFNVSSDEFFYN